ncbi:hypothetical protein V3851_03100 [Paenibacillus sp. M1]|uniref:Lipoprotein n=1 Tax=Paenibacillus haidiansis TaxID=1574488 RepID=A0ABU7VM06_9BACL
MKRIMIIYGLLVLSISLFGCSSSGIDTTSSQITFSGLTNDNDTEVVEGPTSHSYYGKWKITKAVGYGPVSAYGKEDIDQLIGQEVTYSKESAGIPPKEIKNPYYRETIFTEDDFTNHYNIWLENIGVKTNEIKIVQIFMDKDFHENYFETGGDFFLTENIDKLIMFDQGVFFEMDRVNDEN